MTGKQGIMASASAILCATLLLLGAATANATPYGTNITISDGISTGTDWYSSREDNEVEPGMQTGQKWDLEGFFLSGKNLTIVGGYNFYTGEATMDPGDIFIDVDGNAVYSPNYPTEMTTAGPYAQISNTAYQYDYVLDIDWSAGTYDIVQLNDGATVIVGEYGTTYNKPSNPWMYLEGSAGTGSVLGNYTFINYGKASLTDTGFLGSVHYAATFNLGSIDLSNGALFHSTMECGNDNLIGKVPEPSTLLLLGCGLLGLAGMNRRKHSR